MTRVELMGKNILYMEADSNDVVLVWSKTTSGHVAVSTGFLSKIVSLCWLCVFMTALQTVVGFFFI